MFITEKTYETFESFSKLSHLLQDPRKILTCIFNIHWSIVWAVIADSS